MDFSDSDKGGETPTRRELNYQTYKYSISYIKTLIFVVLLTKLKKMKFIISLNLISCLKTNSKTNQDF